MSNYKSRINNSKNYRDRESMKGESEYMGENIQLGFGKGSDRKRLANEIDDNAYDEAVELDVIEDPRYWGEDLQIKFADLKAKDHLKAVKKYERIIKKAYDWVRDSEMGQEVTSVVAVRSAISMPRKIWMDMIEDSEEFEYYAGLITDIIGARVINLGMTDGKGQVFKIFNVKNILEEDYSDRKQINTNSRIEVIEIGGGTKKEIAEEINKSKKRLKK